MFRTLIVMNHVLFEDKLALFCRFTSSFVNFCKHLSTNSLSNHRISEFESLIASEKMKAKNYLVIEDKCNVLPKLNCESVSLLLETQVNKVLKWTFNEKNCALIVINDQNYSLRRDIIRNCGIELKSKKTSINSLRYICLNTCPKLLNDSSLRNQNQRNTDSVQPLGSRKKESLYLNVNHLRESFKSNEDLLKYLLLGKNVSDLDLKMRFYILSQLERFVCHSYFKDYQILPFGSSIAGIYTLV